MIMTDKCDTLVPEANQSEKKMITDTEQFNISIPQPMEDDKKDNNNDLIETDDELLEVGSNEGPDDSDDDEEEYNEENDNSNFSTPLDFTTGRKLSDSGDDQTFLSLTEAAGDAEIKQ